MADKVLAARIVDLREKQDLSQTALAKKLDLDKSSMSKIENGSRKVSSDELKQLSEIFEVTTDYLIGNNKTPKWATEKDITDLNEYLETNKPMNFQGVELDADAKEAVQQFLVGYFWKRRKQEKNDAHE